MTDNPIDLSSLDPTRDSARFAAMTRALARDAMRARERGRVDRVGELARWTRPGLAAALLIAAAAAFALVAAGSQHPRLVLADRATDVAGIPPVVVEWTDTNHHPSPLEVVRVLGQRLNDQ